MIECYFYLLKGSFLPFFVGVLKDLPICWIMHHPLIIIIASYPNSTILYITDILLYKWILVSLISSGWHQPNIDVNVKTLWDSATKAFVQHRVDHWQFISFSSQKHWCIKYPDSIPKPHEIKSYSNSTSVSLSTSPLAIKNLLSVLLLEALYTYISRQKMNSMKIMLHINWHDNNSFTKKCPHVWKL